MNRQQDLEDYQAPLTVNNEHCTTPTVPADKPRTPYELDENFLQTINEWQRRNAAALEREHDSSDADESEDDNDVYATPAEMSPVKSKVASSTSAASSTDVTKVSRTLLAMATQKRLAEMALSDQVFLVSRIHV